MYFLSSVSEAFGYLCCYLNDKYSRKKVLIGFFILSTCFCLVVALTPSTSEKLNIILVILFASLGKAMCSAAYNSVYVFTSQVYPTHVRNTLVSVISCSSRIGSLISPQINMLRTLVWGPLPYFIFSGASLLSCLCTFFLPDSYSIN